MNCQQPSSVHFPPDLEAALQGISEETGLPFADVVNRSLRAGLPKMQDALRGTTANPRWPKTRRSTPTKSA